MNREKGSQTSVGVSLLRSVHQLVDDGPKILVDEVILKLLSSDMINNIQENPDRYNSPDARSLRSHALLRSRYAEDCLAVSYSISLFLQINNHYMI